MSNPLIVLKNDLILRSKGHTPQPPGPQGQPLHASAKQRAEQLIRKYYKGCGTGVLFMAPIVAVQNSTALYWQNFSKRILGPPISNGPWPLSVRDHYHR